MSDLFDDCQKEAVDAYIARVRSRKDGVVNVEVGPDGKTYITASWTPDDNTPKQEDPNQLDMFGGR